MTLDEFVAALPCLQEHYTFFEDDLGMLRGLGRAGSVAEAGAWYSPITALASFRHPGQWWDCRADWERAAAALGLTLKDAAAIVSAEDNDQYADPALAQRLRQAVNLTEKQPYAESDDDCVS